ncbi:MAG: hypothetical protein LBD36_02780 [Holosporales bacterium]|jgi:hypothetical protein|nr:hypothetical protein [Holosporales bacterium]
MKKSFLIMMLWLLFHDECHPMNFLRCLFSGSRDKRPSSFLKECSEDRHGVVSLSADALQAEREFMQSINDWSAKEKSERQMMESLLSISENMDRCKEIASKEPNRSEAVSLINRVEFIKRTIEAFRRKEARDDPIEGDDAFLSSFSRIHGGYLGQINLNTQNEI